jgi:CRISPR-associated exonuclease Cas4
LEKNKISDPSEIFIIYSLNVIIIKYICISMDPDEYLHLGGIQHFAFCKRQWALIHIEQQWAENHLTFSGRVMHKHADNPFFTESRGDILISRGMPLVSHALRIYGIADVVEYHRSDSGIKIPKHKGYWTVCPVEYKSGKKKYADCDEVQLCAQAICLEEMYNTHIPAGNLYYGKTRRRTDVIFNEELRESVSNYISEMYKLYNAGKTPSARYMNQCKSCSLLDLCMPELSAKKSVDAYITSFLGS